MKPKTVCSVVAALLAVVLNLTLASTAHAQGKAALTRDVDRATAQPVSGACSLNARFPQLVCPLYKVPVGKRLVVETVSYDAEGALIAKIYFGKEGFVFALTPQALVGSGRFAATQALLAYFDENVVFNGVATYTPTIDTFYVTFVFSGYLVDK